MRVKTALDLLAVHQLGEFDQPMAHLELLVHAGTEKLVRLWCAWFRSHQNLIEICRKSNG